MARWALGASMLWASSAWAVTSPAAGAVAKPADFEISWPFSAGETVYISSGYSPSGGSSWHDGTDRERYANDYYALDVHLSEHASNGLGEPVLAIASGTVIRAGWATEGWANYGQRVIVQHDFVADGHTYISIYCHLGSVTAVEGQRVAKGDPVGTLGGSSQGSDTGTSYHLHFALHQDSTVGGSGTGGSYGGHAVVPEPIDGAEDLLRHETFISENAGDEPAEPCQRIGSGETIIDERGPCFHRYGPSQYWHDEASGNGGAAFWTYTGDTAAPVNWGIWNLFFDNAGEYELSTFVPSALAQSDGTVYRIDHAGQQGTIRAAQDGAQDDWLPLGRFQFDSGGSQLVRLDDNTGEPFLGEEKSTKIAYDALRIVALPLAGPEQDTDAAVPVSPGRPDASLDAGGAGGAGGAAGLSNGGCQCNELGRSARPSPLCLLPVVLLFLAPGRVRRWRSSARRSDSLRPTNRRRRDHHEP